MVGESGLQFLQSPLAMVRTVEGSQQWNDKIGFKF